MKIILVVFALCLSLVFGCSSGFNKAATRSIQSKSEFGDVQDTGPSQHERGQFRSSQARHNSINSKDGLLPGQDSIPVEDHISLDKEIRYKPYHIEIHSEQPVVFSLIAKFKSNDCNNFFIMDGEVKEIKSKTDSNYGSRNLFADFSIAKTEMGCGGKTPMRIVSLEKEFTIESVYGGIFATLIVSDKFELVRKN